MKSKIVFCQKSLGLFDVCKKKTKVKNSTLFLIELPFLSNLESLNIKELCSDNFFYCKIDDICVNHAYTCDGEDEFGCI